MKEELPSPPHAARHWLSKPLEALLHDLPDPDADGLDFDLLIIGSGYGASAAAAHFSACVDAQGRRLRVAVLERGQEYLPGSFPSRMAELPGAVRFSLAGMGAVKGYRHALFDFRIGPDMVVAQASGLGGGSLINAGVMEPARPEVFAGPAWPQGLRRDPGQMADWYAKASRVLGAVDAQGQPNRIDTLQGFEPRRARFMQSLGQGPESSQNCARTVSITMALGHQPRSAAGLDLKTCVACGDCATGCNHGAKESLDTNLLWQAARQGVQLVTGATVLSVLPRQDGPGWCLQLCFTDEKLREREPAPFALRSRRVILAAGSLGSTEILMRSRQLGLQLSDRLGAQFSGNGDVLAVAVDTPAPLHALADEEQAPGKRQAGPTITAMLDARDERGGFVVQDLAIPGPMRWSLEESFALARTLSELPQGDWQAHGDGPDFDDPDAITPQRSARMMPVAIMGMDSAQGRLGWPGGASHGLVEEGCLQVDWPGARDDPAVQARHDWLAARLAGSGARLLANPMWQPLPPEMAFLVGEQRGPMLTVHPLGGCAMGDDASVGVVNEWGEVYADQVGTAVHEGLVVLDGAIVPASVGINPALTITALALRALPALQRHWAWRSAEALPVPDPSLAVRPVFRQIDAEQARPQRPTQIEIRERMGGFVRLPGAPGGELKYLELSFVYQPQALRELLRPGRQRRLVCDRSGPSRIRLFDAAPDPDHPGDLMAVRRDSPTRQGKLWKHAEWSDADARWVARMAEGELRIFHREASTPSQRRRRALWAWFRNRGWRDSWQAVFERLGGAQHRLPGAPGVWPTLMARAKEALALASHAGQVRLMGYTVRIQTEPDAEAPWAQPLIGALLAGDKRISYTRRGNPWTQLSQMRLHTGPFLAVEAGDRRGPLLTLDLYHLARQRQALLRITDAQDLPSTMRDVGSLAAYLLRLLIRVHVWTFRKPDAAPRRRIERLPGRLPGLPEPEVSDIVVGRRGEAGQSRKPVQRPARPDDEAPVHIRLTRYRGQRAQARPLLMLHGYSTSANTFAHPAVPRGPAQLMWEAGFDVWLLDLRTSSGLPSATLPWTFEESALNDIPVAIDHVLRVSGQPQLDVLAHCMASAMLHMALLQPAQQPGERFFPLRQRLMSERLIRRLVISQVTPRMVFSPSNTLRAALMQQLRPLIGQLPYSFRPEGEPGLVDQLLDRLLASMPYPEHEFDLENPPWPAVRKTPWTATRHRMDLLYGRTFALQNLAPVVLDHIDDLFGPLNLDTVTQAVAFARQHQITDWRGASVYLDDLAKLMNGLLDCPVLSIHGQDNGLCDASSGELYRQLCEQMAPGRMHYRIVHGHGHQDCLIGRHVERAVFPPIIRFLTEDFG